MIIARHKHGGFHIVDEFGNVMRFDSVEQAKEAIAKSISKAMVSQFDFIDESEQ